MNDGQYEIDILDAEGKVASKKLRKDAIKGVDIYHAVYGVIITPDKKIVVSLIGNPEGMPNLHAGKLGCTCATIRRTDESADEAMARAIKNELYIEPDFVKISEEFVDIDNTKRLITFYVVTSDIPKEFNRSDIEELSAHSEPDFMELLNSKSDRLTPPLKLFWNAYNM